MYKILASDKLGDDGVGMLQAEKNLEFTHMPGLGEDKQKLIELVKDYDALIVRSATKVTEDVIDAGKKGKLKLIARAGTGVDNVDIKAAKKHGIIVMNTPTANSDTVAELAIGMMFMLSRNLYNAVHSIKSGLWEKSKFKGNEIMGKTLGIIGFGNIGKRVAKRAVALGMKVIAYDACSCGESMVDQVSLVNLEELFSKSDFITVHLPLNESTKNFLGKSSFEKMKKGVFIVDCSRGGILNHEELVPFLDNGKIGGVALDVYPKEPLGPDCKIIGYDNVICSPHIGAATTEAQNRVSTEIAQQVIAYFKEGKVINQVC